MSSSGEVCDAVPFWSRTLHQTTMPSCDSDNVRCKHLQNFKIRVGFSYRSSLSVFILRDDGIILHLALCRHANAMVHFRECVTFASFGLSCVSGTQKYTYLGPTLYCDVRETALCTYVRATCMRAKEARQRRGNSYVRSASLLFSAEFGILCT